MEKATLKFLEDLKKNNQREWFQAHRPAYEAALADFTKFLIQLIREIGRFDPAVAKVEAPDCIFRIYRDVRFARDKQPYKTHFGAYLAPGGRKSEHAAYYVHLEPGSSMLAGGRWMPPADQLRAIREAVARDPKAFTKIIRAAPFKKAFGDLDGEQLKRIPQGFAADHPAAELLKFKSYVAIHRVSNAKILASDLNSYAASVFKTLKPLNDFLNKATGT
ncbi:MAG: DUF2461 domain-containing protein [Leptospirales bacterium]|nr:DUF2461 domain-containing protein [Leptospirales bacterium]